MGPAGVVEQCEGQVGLEDGVGDLGGEKIHIYGEGATLGRLVRPLGLLARLLEAAHRGQGLGTDDQGQVEAVAPDVLGGVDDQALGHRAADARVGRAGLGRAEPGGQTHPGVVVLPRLAVHDIDALQLGQGVRGAGVGRGVPRHQLPHVERLGCPVGGIGGVPGGAGDADQARCAGVHGQGVGWRLRRCGTSRAWRWPGQR